jgi:DNA invertase Pin-like site-specific DNA recombinase
MDENQVGKKRRARRTGKEVQRLVEEFVSGGMKRSEFCRARGLSLGTLRRHLKGGKQKAKQPQELALLLGGIDLEKTRARNW